MNLCADFTKGSMASRCAYRLASLTNRCASGIASKQPGLKLEATASWLMVERQKHRNAAYEQFGKKLMKSHQGNPRNMDEVHKLGLTALLKKNRMYAQYNYEEWRYPERRRAIDISCTRFILKEYEDKEGMMSRLRNPKTELTEKRNEFLSHRQIKRKVPDFHRKRFPAEAQEIYIKVHDLLNTENWTLEKQEETEEKLHGLVTEHAYPGMLQGLEVKTVKWKFVESIEAPRVVQTICAPLINENNFYAQVTVRFHTRQILTVHDRFGRFMLGSADVPREVLEYVTFERHISDPYGKWRIHAKKLAPDQRIEEMNKTVSIIKRKPQRSMADEWHKQEAEEFHYKWYPARPTLQQQAEALKRKKRGTAYWKRRRKLHVLTKMRIPLTRMRKGDMKKVGKKRYEVISMRQRGELPMPPE